VTLEAEHSALEQLLHWKPVCSVKDVGKTFSCKKNNYMLPNTQKHQNSQHAFYKGNKVLYAYTEETVDSKILNAHNYSPK